MRRRIRVGWMCACLVGGVAPLVQAYERGMTLITPAEQWREALPAGNGQVGALVYGAVNEERVLFNHNELWYMGKIDEVPDMSAELPVVRKMMLEGHYLEANGHYRKVMQEKGFNARNAVYHPAFDLLVTVDSKKMFEDYARTLDFETGEVVVKWRDGAIHFERRLFVSMADDVAVMAIQADQQGAISGQVTLDIHDLRDAIDQRGAPFDPGFTYDTKVDGEFVTFQAEGSDGGDFGGVVRVLTQGGTCKANVRTGKGAKSFLSIAEADEVLLVVGLFANEPGAPAIERLKKELSGVTEGYTALFARHEPLHRAKFGAMGINLNIGGTRTTPNEELLLEAYQGPAPLELIEKMFDYGRYLLICSSRAGGYPPGLQGIWNGDYRPPWSGLYGINENLQMTYWQALPGNMKESMMAFYDYFDAHLDEFRYNAKQLWGCRGIYIPPFMSPESGVMRHTAPHVVHWTDAAGWLASFYYDYYLFTGDKVFLEKRAIPFMKEVALFYEDYIVKDAQGKNMFVPSQSPENQPADKVVVDPKTGRTQKIKVQINATISVAVAKEVFHNLVAACELLEVEQAGVKRWKAMLADMPAYQVNEDGALREWMHPDFKDNYEHRHQSHIYPLFPGQEITEESTPKLYEACKVAIEKRLTIGLKSQTGWSLAHMANVYARLGEGDRAQEALNILMRCCLGKNFFTYHNDWRNMGVTMKFLWGRSAPFQMDANFGISAAVTEMLCGSNADMVRVLPALPARWRSGSFHDVLTRAGVRTSAQWDMTQKEILLTLVAERDTSFDLKFPGEIAKLECAQPDLLKVSPFGSQYRSLQLKAGTELNVRVLLK